MSDVTDRYDLRRFDEAQDGCYRQVCDELRSGRKRGHWIWFIFPQLQGLGSSPAAVSYGIRSLAEARAYLAHPVLGPRLRECARLLAGVRGRSITEIMCYPDDLKVCSSMTLFAAAADSGAESRAEFQAVLDNYYEGRPDTRTLQMLSAG